MRTDRSTVSPTDLSLAAELLLFAVDPRDGGLLPHSRLRLRKALAVAHDSGYGLPGAAWRARRAARGELTRAGWLERGRLALADRPRVTARFRAVCRCFEEQDAADDRDWELLVLLAWAGPLAHRLSKDERRLAERRLRGLFKTVEGDRWGFPGGEHALPTWLARVGGIEELAEEIDLFDSPEFVDFGRDHSPSHYT